MPGWTGDDCESTCDDKERYDALKCANGQVTQGRDGLFKGCCICLIHSCGVAKAHQHMCKACTHRWVRLHELEKAAVKQSNNPHSFLARVEQVRAQLGPSLQVTLLSSLCLYLRAT
jgi:hypothetical protein